MGLKIRFRDKLIIVFCTPSAITLSKTWFALMKVDGWALSHAAEHGMAGNCPIKEIVLDHVNMGFLLLEGGAEFGGGMSEPDLRAIELAGGPDAPIAILPTAAAPDNNHERAGRNGISWFRSLGASQVMWCRLSINPAANDPALAARLRSARFIYLLGGFPRHLGNTERQPGLAGGARSLPGRRSDRRQQRRRHGAVRALLRSHDGRLLEGLNLLPHSCVLPHHNRSARNWAGPLSAQLT